MNAVRQLLALCENERLTDAQKLELLAVVLDAHDRSAWQNANLSSLAIQLGREGAGDFGKAVACALMTLGVRHGPVTAARRAIYHGERTGGRIPGWGNSFHKHEIDPAWQTCADYLKAHYPIHHDALAKVTLELEERGKRLHPNAAAFTAAAAQILGIPEGVELVLFLMGRLPTWALLFSVPRA